MGAYTGAYCKGTYGVLPSEKNRGSLGKCSACRRIVPVYTTPSPSDRRSTVDRLAAHYPGRRTAVVNG